jgi:predicted acyl esterase
MRPWTAKLVDVFPDGRAINLNNGIIRARYRDSLDHSSPISPGQIYKYVINVWPTSNVFLPEHRIPLEVSSSNFPHCDRILILVTRLASTLRCRLQAKPFTTMPNTHRS